MKIIIAPDSFKGSCTAITVASATERGVKKAYPDAKVVKLPVADGGEGTVDVLVLAAGGEYRELEVTGPLGGKVVANYGILPDGTAIIEAAAASGLPLLPLERRNPWFTTTYGTGELIKAALDQGYRRIVIGIGGSATNDGGAGMARALGVSFRDQYGNELGFGGGELGRLHDVDIRDLDPRLKEAEIVVACDVANPLCGPEGASLVYGPQKGGTPEMLKELDRNLSRYARIISRQLGVEIADLPGAGAAGGLGAGLMIFCRAKLKPGIDTVLDAMNFDHHLQDADLVITGEGQIDGQSVYGKVPVGVARRAKKFGLPVLALAGSIGDGAGKTAGYGIDGILSIVPGPISLQASMSGAETLIEKAAERAMRVIRIGQNLGVRHLTY
ncbi:MAG: glycerate kinase [Peptococcaceae bacterium BRH_c4b]|nr:MAG: glycerate kinase [Peptococcaceae bacterium BRH_c4b]